jgi:hypothetical protein
MAECRGGRKKEKKERSDGGDEDKAGRQAHGEGGEGGERRRHARHRGKRLWAAAEWIRCWLGLGWLWAARPASGATTPQAVSAAFLWCLLIKPTTANYGSCAPSLAFRCCEYGLRIASPGAQPKRWLLVRVPSSESTNHPALAECNHWPTRGERPGSVLYTCVLVVFLHVTTKSGSTDSRSCCFLHRNLNEPNYLSRRSPRGK